MANQIADDATKLKALRADYIATFSTEEGKRVLASLEESCMFKTTIFNKDALTMAFQEGMRSVYLHIKTIMEMDIEQLERIVNASSQGR